MLALNCRFFMCCSFFLRFSRCFALVSFRLKGDMEDSSGDDDTFLFW